MKKFGYLLIGLLVGFGASGVLASTGDRAWITDGLTLAQRDEIWQGASRQVADESALPADFRADIGESVPASMKLQPMPKNVSDQVPAVKPYDFAMLQDQLLIVDPGSRKIIDIITK
jgi:hypothetical protein